MFALTLTGCWKTGRAYASRKAAEAAAAAANARLKNPAVGRWTVVAVPAMRSAW
jgi:hypothetical protein